MLAYSLFIRYNVSHVSWTAEPMADPFEKLGTRRGA